MVSVVGKGWRGMERWGFIILLSILAGLKLAGCTLDKEEKLRAELASWLELKETLEFSSKATCTAAVFRLETTDISDRISRVNSVDTAVQYLKGGRTVVFDMPDASPNTVSEWVMTGNLETGLGLLSNGVGPAQRCLSDRAGIAFYNAIMSPEARMVYDPEGNAMTVVHVQSEVPLAIFLRGNV